MAASISRIKLYHEQEKDPTTNHGTAHPLRARLATRGWSYKSVKIAKTSVIYI